MTLPYVLSNDNLFTTKKGISTTKIPFFVICAKFNSILAIL